MKSAIAPDIWETKRRLITKLYKDEEWPLKQVIKLVQTRDFHPSESQLRSRLKKWHITKPSRKKYDGSKRLSGTKKKLAHKSLSESHHSSATSSTLQSHLPQPLPLRKADESDSFSDGKSETSRPSGSIPEMSVSPANQYTLPSSPLTSPTYGSNTLMAPSTPISPGSYGMEDSKRAPNDTSHPIHFYPQNLRDLAFPPNSAQIPYPPHMYFNSFSEASPLAIPEHPQADYLGYPGGHYLPSQSFSHQKDPAGVSFGMSDLPPPLLDWSWVANPSEGYPYHPSHSYFQEACMQPLAAPIYQAM